MSRETNLSDLLEGQSSNVRTNSIVGTPSTSGSASTNDVVQVPTKRKYEVKGKPNSDPYHESHKNPRLDYHYKRIGLTLYACNGNKSDNTKCDYRAESQSVRNHTRMCFPNLRKSHSQQFMQYFNSNSEEVKQKVATRKAEKRDEGFDARLKGNPTLKCTFLNCSTFLYTPYELTQHIYDTHTRDRSGESFPEFLALDKWKRNWQEYDGSDKNADIQKASREFISTRSKGSYWAYIVIFLPNTVVDVNSAWIYLHNNCEDSTCIIPYYSGKGSSKNDSANSKFNVEDFHFHRSQSTVIDYIKETGKRAFQLCAIKQNCLASSEYQESIFQMVGNYYSVPNTLRPNSAQFLQINKRAELTNWEKLSEDDFNMAIDFGLSQQPLLCLQKHCMQSHKTNGNFYGKLHQDEVDLIPFQFHV